MFEQEGLIYKRVYDPREQVLSEFRRVCCVAWEEKKKEVKKLKYNRINHGARLSTADRQTATCL